MRHLAAYFVAGVLFALASVLLWLGRAAIGTSTPLLLAVLTGYLSSLSIAAPAQMAAARSACVEWYHAWKSSTGAAA